MTRIYFKRSDQERILAIISELALLEKDKNTPKGTIPDAIKFLSLLLLYIQESERIRVRFEILKTNLNACLDYIAAHKNE